MNKEKIFEKFRLLKLKSGSHSPSYVTLKNEIPELDIRIDACFLSNPYATELFWEYFKKEVVDTKEIIKIFEFYPSQNQIISNIIGDYLGISSTKIFVANGATEAIQAVLHNFNRGKVVVNIPTFSPYYEFIPSSEDIVFFKLNKKNDFILDVSEYLKFINKIKPDTIILINPNNPNGGYLSYDKMKFLISQLQWVKNIIIDESFIDFSYESEDLELMTSVNLVNSYNNIIIIKSLSKDFGIAGLRCGYVIMNEDYVSKLLRNGYLWNINGFAEYFYSLYTREDFAQKYNFVRKKYILEFINFINELKKIKGIKVYPTKANFALIELLNGMKAVNFTFELLFNYGIYVRDASDKIGLDGEFIRVAGRTSEENRAIVKSINEIISNLN